MIVDHRNVGAVFRRLSLPIAYALLGDQLLGIVDTIAIGSIGTVALAGVTGAFAIFIAVLFALTGFSSGVSIIGAQRIGAHDIDGFARTVRAGFVAPLAGAFFCIVASLFFAEPALRLMLGTLPSLHGSAQYLVWRCVSLVPMMVSIIIASGLGAAGNRRVAVQLLVVINAVHVPLVFVLALGWLTYHPLGVAGAGISSLLAEIIGAAYMIGYVLKHPQYRIFSSLSIDLRLAWQTARLSFPEVVFLFAVLLPDAFIVSMLAPLGALTIAGFRALNIVSDFTFVAPIPLQEATQTVIGQRLGARDVAGAQAFFRGALQFSVRFTALVALIVAVLAWPLAFAFTLNATVASIAAVPLALHMLSLPLKGYSMVAMAPLRAAGDTRFSMFAGLISSMVALPLVWIGVKMLHIGLYAVPLAWVSAWCARSALTALRLQNGDWTRRTLQA
ncbi:MAG: MATE family efflux transporter [Candidatus Eremiobacteraeota bacterium]|nr:MATE family efflux transporter [Candidatus Eremiobacteraeota bacterium]